MYKRQGIALAWLASKNNLQRTKLLVYWCIRTEGSLMTSLRVLITYSGIRSSGKPCPKLRGLYSAAKALNSTLERKVKTNYASYTNSKIGPKSVALPGRLDTLRVGT